MPLHLEGHITCCNDIILARPLSLADATDDKDDNTYGNQAAIQRQGYDRFQDSLEGVPRDVFNPSQIPAPYHIKGVPSVKVRSPIFPACQAVDGDACVSRAVWATL